MRRGDVGRSSRCACLSPTPLPASTLPKCGLTFGDIRPDTYDASFSQTINYLRPTRRLHGVPRQRNSPSSDDMSSSPMLLIFSDLRLAAPVRTVHYNTPPACVPYNAAACPLRPPHGRAAGPSRSKLTSYHFENGPEKRSDDQALAGEYSASPDHPRQDYWQTMTDKHGLRWMTPIGFRGHPLSRGWTKT